ncbi:MAG: NAD(P)H-dependent glycerol-3-phosphate dehydrogenase [Planctomycetota bacterium]
MPDAAQHVSFVGDGAMATVLALLLESKGVGVTVWGPTPENVAEMIQLRENRRYLAGVRLPDAIRLTADPAVAFRGADLIVSAIPTQYMRPVWERLKPYAPAGVPMVSVAKGIEKDTILRPTQVLADTLGESDDRASARSYASLSGPSVADELAKCLPATVAAASSDAELAETIQATFTTQWFRVYTNPDLLGVELAGALKNVIALAAGILDGLSAGNNAKSALLARGLAEIARLGNAMGATPETFFGLTGVGDLATTCFSPTGRNRTAGEMLGKGQKLDAVLEQIPGVVEGIPTTQAVVKLAQQHGVEMPITQAVNQVLFENLDPLDAISNLMSREPKTERVG